MLDLREYRGPDGRCPFREWFDRLNAEAARKVTTALYRLGQGNFSNAKSVGAGVSECKINFGPGYRVYYGMDGDQIVILLGAARRSANKTTSSWPSTGGKTTSSEEAQSKNRE
jgi:putative addiction module killer protein